MRRPVVASGCIVFGASASTGSRLNVSRDLVRDEGIRPGSVGSIPRPSPASLQLSWPQVVYRRRSCCACLGPARVAEPTLARRMREGTGGGEQGEHALSSFPSGEQLSPVPIFADENRPVSCSICRLPGRRNSPSPSLRHSRYSVKPGVVRFGGRCGPGSNDTLGKRVATFSVNDAK